MSLCYHHRIKKYSEYASGKLIELKNESYLNRYIPYIHDKYLCDTEIDGEKRRDYIYNTHVKSVNNRIKNWCLNVKILLNFRGNWKFSNISGNLDFVICDKSYKRNAKIVHDLLNFVNNDKEIHFLPKLYRISSRNIHKSLLNLRKNYEKNVKKKHFSDIIVLDNINDDLIDINYVINDKRIRDSNFVIKCYVIFKITNNYKSIYIYNNVPVHVGLKNNRGNVYKNIVLECRHLVGNEIYNNIIFPQMIKIIKSIIKMNILNLDCQKLNYIFKLLTFKIILDKNHKCWLKKVSSDVPNLGNVMFNSFYNERHSKLVFIDSVLKTCIDPIFPPLYKTDMLNLFTRIYHKNHIIENIIKHYVMPKVHFSNGEDITFLRYKHKFNELMIYHLEKSNICPRHYMFSIYDKRLLAKLEELKTKYKILFLKPYSKSIGYKRKVSDNVQDVVSWISKHKNNCKKWAINEYIDNPMLFYINGERPSGKIYNDKFGRKNIIRVCVLKFFTKDEVTTYMSKKKIILVSPKHYNMEDNESLIANYDQINDLCKSDNGKEISDFHFNLDDLTNGKFDINLDNNELNSQIVSILKLVSQHFIKNLRKSIKQNPISLLPSFHLFTYDFLIDKNRKLWLLKINSQPSHTCLKNLLKKTFNSIMNNVINLFNSCINNEKYKAKKISDNIKFNRIISVKVR